jgi:CTP:molybdopterin cytidylyltransferase MocA
MAGTTGIVLAAGAGTRAGGPKALRRNGAGTPWLALACGVLREAGCSRLIVVLGASAGAAAGLVPADAEVVEAGDWRDGMAASLRAGVAAASGHDVLITLVDLPGLSAEVARRVLATSGPLRRAVFEGRPGHPVFVAAEHLDPFAASLHGDSGGREYLDAHGVTAVECGDLGDGRDVDEAVG